MDTNGKPDPMRGAKPEPVIKAEPLSKPDTSFTGTDTATRSDPVSRTDSTAHAKADPPIARSEPAARPDPANKTDPVSSAKPETIQPGVGTASVVSEPVTRIEPAAKVEAPVQQPAEKADASSSGAQTDAALIKAAAHAPDINQHKENVAPIKGEAGAAPEQAREASIAQKAAAAATENSENRTNENGHPDTAAPQQTSNEAVAQNLKAGETEEKPEIARQFQQAAEVVCSKTGGADCNCGVAQNAEAASRAEVEVARADSFDLGALAGDLGTVPPNVEPSALFTQEKEEPAIVKQFKETTVTVCPKGGSECNCDVAQNGAAAAQAKVDIAQADAFDLGALAGSIGEAASATRHDPPIQPQPASRLAA